MKKTFICKKFDELTTRELYEIVRSRSEIFILEQEIICQDFDGIDYDSLHCFIMDSGRVIAYLRAFYYGDYIKIGRVLTLTHGKGLGRELMERSIPKIREIMGNAPFILHAQTYAEGFYNKFGFVKTSDEFIEDSILHIEMQSE